MAANSNEDMREALSDIIDKINQWRTDGSMEHWQYSQLFDIADSALALPRRQCDVGTAEEQEVRFRNYCWNHSSRDKNMECQCPIDAEGKAGCKLTWAQMPYEKGESNGSK